MFTLCVVYVHVKYIPHVCARVWEHAPCVHVCLCLLNVYLLWVCVLVCVYTSVWVCAVEVQVPKRPAGVRTRVRASVNCLCGEQDPRSSSVRLANTLNAEPPISTVLRPRLLLKVLSFRPDGLDVGRTENGKSGNKNKTFLVAQALSFRLPGLCSYYLKSNKKIDWREKDFKIMK